MKKVIITLLMACLPVSMLYARDVVVTMHKIGPAGIENSVGVVVVSETGNGLRFTPHLYAMETGNYQFTINETMSCQNKYSETGISMPGMASGNSIWALPDLRVSTSGAAKAPVELANVRLSDVSKKSIVISRKSGSGFGSGSQPVACGSLEYY